MFIFNMMNIHLLVSILKMNLQYIRNEFSKNKLVIYNEFFIIIYVVIKMNLYVSGLNVNYGA